MATFTRGWSAGTTYPGELQSPVLTHVTNSSTWLRSAATSDWSGSSEALGVSGAVIQLSESKIVRVLTCDASALVSVLSAAASPRLRAVSSKAPWKEISSKGGCGPGYTVRRKRVPP